MKLGLGFVWEKFCDMMIGLDNLSGKLVYADKLFAKKPKTLGEGLARIKKKFGIIEQKEPLMKDSRLYVAKDGSYVHFDNLNFCNSSALHISKEVQPVPKETYNKVFAYEPANLEKHYINTNLGNEEVHIDRAITVEYFKPAKLGKSKGELIASHNIDRPGVQELRLDNFYHDFYHNSKFIPYAKASAMGLKV